MEPLSSEFIEQAACGNIAAFEELYKITSSFVFSIAVRMAGNREEAEEITQDVFIKVYHHLKDFSFKSSLKTWIYRITVNTTYTHIKNKVKERERRNHYEQLPHKHYTQPAVIGDAKQEEAEHKITALLSVLNEDQKLCLILRDIEGLHYQEIAEILHIKINTVRTRIKRARTALLKHGLKKGVTHEV